MYYTKTLPSTSILFLLHLNTQHARVEWEEGMEGMEWVEGVEEMGGREGRE